MTEKKKSIIFYLDMLEPLSILSDESRGRVIMALFNYAIKGIIPEFTDLSEKVLFTVMKTTLDRDEEKYREVCRRNAENGKKGGRPKKQQAATEAETSEGFSEEAKKADSDNDSDSESVSESDSESESESVNESESILFSPTKETNEMFGSAENIPLTASEYRRLCIEYTKSRTDAEIERLSLSCGRSEPNIRSCFALLVKRLSG